LNILSIKIVQEVTTRSTYDGEDDDGSDDGTQNNSNHLTSAQTASFVAVGTRWRAARRRKCIIPWTF